MAYTYDHRTASATTKKLEAALAALYAKHVPGAERIDIKEYSENAASEIETTLYARIEKCFKRVCDLELQTKPGFRPGGRKTEKDAWSSRFDPKLGTVSYEVEFPEELTTEVRFTVSLPKWLEASYKPGHGEPPVAAVVADHEVMAAVEASYKAILKKPNLLDVNDTVGSKLEEEALQAGYNESNTDWSVSNDEDSETGGYYELPVQVNQELRSRDPKVFVKVDGTDKLTFRVVFHLACDIIWPGDYRSRDHW